MGVFDDINKVLSEDLVKKTNAVYSFTVTDQGTNWFLDLKNGAGSCGQGESPTAVDASFKMSSANFGKMFAGKLKPTAAFMWKAEDRGQHGEGDEAGEADGADAEE